MSIQNLKFSKKSRSVILHKYLKNAFIKPFLYLTKNCNETDRNFGAKTTVFRPIFIKKQLENRIATPKSIDRKIPLISNLFTTYENNIHEKHGQAL